MDFSFEVILLLQYLLPGFITAWVFYGLTAYARPTQFERVIQALIFTFFIHIFVELLKYYVGESYRELIKLCAPLIIAIAMGLLFTYCANNDSLHKWLRQFKITKETAFPSEWFGAFKVDQETKIVLHLQDERRLYGFLKEWPSESRHGHFLITYPSWLVDCQEESITGVEHILIDVRDVKWVEFMEKISENRDV